MKVVLFCGGMGTRIREYSDTIPKPMVPLGDRPILWHIMKYYASFGHRDFILCLGYKGGYIKEYFLEYSECVSNDFVLSEGGRKIELLREDISDWRVTFVDTGVSSNVGERLPHQIAAVDAAERAGVSHILYTSITSPYPHPRHAVANDHFWTEARLFQTKGGWTALRDNLYADFVVWSAQKTLTEGKIVHALIQQPGEVASAREKTWGAHEKLTIERGVKPATGTASRKSKSPRGKRARRPA